MKALNSSHALDKTRQQGSILIPVLIVAIIIVLVLMWQAGMFSSSSSSPATSTGLQQDHSVTTTPGPSESDASLVETTPDPQGLSSVDRDAPLGPDATPSQIAERKARDFVPLVPYTGDGDGDGLQRVTPKASGNDANGNLALDAAGQAVAIEEAAAILIARHSPDFSVCRSAGNAIQNLECAAGAQTRALQSAFETHNAQRASGDKFALANGAAIMKRVVEHMQNSLDPFVEAADSL